MKHSVLPWRITDASEKKGREIVDARGSTVAKLTALDMANAELIVSSVNASMPKPSLLDDVPKITNKLAFVEGREYWMLHKCVNTIDSVTSVTCDKRGLTIKSEDFPQGLAIVFDKASEGYDFYGPIPEGATPRLEILSLLIALRQTE